MQKLKSLIKAARSGLTTDSGKRRFVNVTYQGKTMKAIDITPYGFFHHTPENGLAVVLSQNGQESNAFAIVDDPDNRTIKNTSAGESGLQNDVTGAFIYLKANGDIVIDAPNNVVVNAGGDINANAVGEITATAGGDVTVDAGGSITATASGSIDFDGASGSFTADGGITFTVSGTTFVFSSSGLEITGGGLITNGLNFETHIHSQGNDSNGDSEVDTGTPHA